MNSISDATISAPVDQLFFRSTRVLAHVLGWEERLGGNHPFGRLWGSLDALFGINAFPCLRKEHPREILAIALSVALHDEPYTRYRAKKYDLEVLQVNRWSVRVSFPLNTWYTSVRVSKLERVVPPDFWEKIYYVSMLNADIISQESDAPIYIENMREYLQTAGVG